MSFLEISISSPAPSVAAKKTRWLEASTPSQLVFSTPNASVRILKRQAYPQTFAYVKNSLLICGYGDPAKAESILAMSPDVIPEEYLYDNEFLYIAVDCSQSTIVIQRDAYNTVATFLGVQPDRCVVTSEFAKTFSLLDRRYCRLNKICVAKSLACYKTFEETFVDAIEFLYDRKRVHWSPQHGLKRYLPKDAAMKDYHLNRQGDAKQFSHLLEDTIQRYKQRYIGNGVTACELSCGLDSAVVAGYLADQGYHPVTATAMFPGQFANTQQHKLTDFTNRFKVTPLTVPAAYSLDFPWMEVLQGITSRPFFHNTAYPYWTYLDDISAGVARHGATAIFTGIGGDELFENVHHRLVLTNATSTTGRFNEFPAYHPLVEYLEQVMPAERTKHRPIPLSSHSSLTTNAANGDHLRHGLWEIHPLGDPRLYAYMQSVPLRYCVDKLLLRIYARARRIPKSIYQPVVNEDFRDVNTHSSKQLDAITLYALQTSVLADMGLVDKKQLMQAYQDLREAKVADPDTMYLLFDRFLFTELNIRSLGLKPA